MTIKRVFLAFFAIIIFAGIVIFAWPVAVDRQSTDPAVDLFNAWVNGLNRLREGYFEHNGNRLHFVESGQGGTIVFIHGFPSFLLSFLRQIDHFKDSHHVIAIDGLGAGKSDAPSDQQQYRLEAMMEHLIALLDDLSVRKVHLVGHDWGSVFAIGFAQRHPDRVLFVTGLSAPALNAQLYVLEPTLRLLQVRPMLSGLNKSTHRYWYYSAQQTRFTTALTARWSKPASFRSERGSGFEQQPAAQGVQMPILTGIAPMFPIPTVCQKRTFGHLAMHG